MRKIAAWGVMCCISTLALADEPAEPAATAGLSVDQVVEKNIAARGGLEAWRNIQTMVWVGHIERGNAPTSSFPFALKLKRPNKTRFEIEAKYQTAVRAFDGTHGWKLSPAGSGKPELQPYSAEELRFAADGPGIDGLLMDYQAKGLEVALDGVDEVEGHKAYRLKVKFPSGASRRVWIDAQTFLEIKYDRASRDIRGQPGTISVFYRNYTTTEGLQIPLMIESRAETGKATDKMVIDKILLNQPLADAMFDKPRLRGRRNVSLTNSGAPQTARPPRLLPPQLASGMRKAR